MTKRVHEATASEIADAAYNAARGGITDAMSAEELAEHNRKAAAARLDNAESERERRAEGKRLARIRRELLSGISTLRHGEKVSPAQRQAMVRGIVRGLGDVKPSELATIRALVDEAADASAEGDKVTGWRAVDGAAEALANSSETVGTPAPVEDDDEMDPVVLAARIPRS